MINFDKKNLKEEVEKLREEVNELRRRDDRGGDGSADSEATAPSSTDFSRRDYLAAAGIVGTGTVLSNVEGIGAGSGGASTQYAIENERFRLDRRGNVAAMNSFATGSAVPFDDGLEVGSDVTDDAGVTVYDEANRTVGDATTRASHRNVNNELYATGFPGADLSERIRNALDALEGGRGRIRVTPRDDGADWQWTDDLTLDPFAYEGIQIDVDETVRIEYTGTGVALTVDTGGRFANGTKSFRLTGGHWDGTNDPEGWFRGIDLGNAHIAPRWIGMRAGPSSSFGIQLRNRNRWSEMNTIAPRYIDADTAIAFVGASYNPDSTADATDSFHGQRVTGNLHCTDVGIECRGNMQYSLFDSPQVFLFGDGAKGFLFDGGSAGKDWGSTIVAGKTEEHAADTTAFHLGPDFDGFYNTPTLVGGFYEHPTNVLTATAGATNTTIYNPVAVKNGYEIRMYEPGNTSKATFASEGPDGSVSLSIGEVAGDPDGTQLRVNDAHHTAYTPQDVRGLSPARGWVAYHDGSDATTEGPAFYDGSDWISQVDGTTIS